MGQCTHYKTISSEWDHWQYVLGPLNFTMEDFCKLHQLFTSLVVHDAGERVLIQHLSRKLDIQSEDYLIKATHIFRDSNRRSLEFIYFGFWVWNYCTVPADLLVENSFSFYDEMNVNSISKARFRLMLMDIFTALNPTKSTIEFHGLQVDIALSSLPAEISRATLKQFIANYPEFSVYFVKFQRHIQSRLLGVERWTELSSKPVAMLDGALLTIEDFKSMNLFENLLVQGEAAFHGSSVSSDSKDVIDTARSGGSSVSIHNSSKKNNSRPIKNTKHRSRKFSHPDFIVTANLTVMKVVDVTTRGLFSISPNKVYPIGSKKLDCSSIDPSERDSFMQDDSNLNNATSLCAEANDSVSTNH